MKSYAGPNQRCSSSKIKCSMTYTLTELAFDIGHIICEKFLHCRFDDFVGGERFNVILLTMLRNVILDYDEDRTNRNTRETNHCS